MLVYPNYEDYLIYEGRTFTAEWYYTTKGEMPAFDYYKGLSAMDQGRLDDLVMYFCDRPFGELLPKSMYRIEDHENKLYAFKPRDERFFNFTTHEAKVIITNAYHKHSQQMSKSDMEQLKIAARYREDYLMRIKEGYYYEK